MADSKVITKYTESIDERLDSIIGEFKKYTKIYKLYLSEKDELLKIKGFDGEGGETFQKGLSVLSRMGGSEAKEEVYIYRDIGEGDIFSEETLVHYLFLNNEGSMLHKSLINGRYLEEWIRKFDKMGWVTEDKHTFIPFNASVKMNYSFDGNGNLLESTIFDLDGTEERKNIYTYNDRKKPVKQEVFFSGLKDLYLNTYSIFEYDEEDRLINETTYLNNGHIISRITHSYDGKKEIERQDISQTTEGKTITILFNFSYDGQGNILKERISINGKYKNTKEYKYDSEGRLTEQKIIGESGRVEGYLKFTYEHMPKKNLETEKFRSFLKDRFYLDFLTWGNVILEEGYSKSADNKEFYYKLKYEYDKLGRLTRVFSVS